MFRLKGASRREAPFLFEGEGYSFKLVIIVDSGKDS